MPRILQIKEFSGSGTTPSYFLLFPHQLGHFGPTLIGSVGHGLQTSNESFFFKYPKYFGQLGISAE